MHNKNKINSYQIVHLLLNNLIITVLGTLLASSSFAIASSAKALTLVTERSALNANDSLDFGSIEPVFNPFAPPNPDSFLENSFSAISTNGLELDFTIAPTDNPAISPPFIFQTGFPPNGIPTNFPDGDFLLFTGAAFGSFPAPGNSAPITIDFATPVNGAGTQIAVDDTFSFTASVSAFDDAGNLLDSFSAPGTSSIELDNSALFLGVLSEEANIARLVYSSSVENRAIGINTVSINDGTTIPEPSMIFGLLIIAGSSIYGFASKSRYTL